MVIPKGYRSALCLRDTESAIKYVKDEFQKGLSAKLKLTRVSAPLFVKADTGLNDNLSGKERAVAFEIPVLNCRCEIVQSLAKWKRWALKKYEFLPYEGIYTDMNAIRRDEGELDNLHSVYVDQWDWEKIVNAEDRNENFLKETVKKIYGEIFKLHLKSCERFGLKDFLKDEITFIDSEELLKMYPNLSQKEREEKFVKAVGSAFIMRIGGKLSNGEPHDLRAPDYDDWTLNGDILVWYPVLDCVVELSSMGIRVDEDSLKRQLALAGVDNLTAYHKAVLNKELPLTIGGGIGQSRLCLIMLQKAHIGEVQSSCWSEEDVLECEKCGVRLL